MSLVSFFEPVPNRVRTLARIVASVGSVTREELRTLITPATDGGDDQFKNLLRETVNLGLVEESKKTIKLGGGIKAADVRNDEWFLDFTEKALLQTKDKDSHLFALALAWLLTRPPDFNLEWRSEFHTQMLEDMEGKDVYTITNQDRAAMLAYWARFLGYAEGIKWKTKNLVVPDPTTAIARHLNSVFGKATELPVATFIKKLSKHCPVLEGGDIRSEVEGRLKKKRDPKTFSLSTSLAMIRLEQRGVIKLDAPSDADVMLLDFKSDDPRRVSHVNRIG